MGSFWDYVPVNRAEIRAIITNEVNKILISAIRTVTEQRFNEIDSHIEAVEESVTILGETMPANWDALNTDLQTLIAGYQSVVAENVILKQQLSSADADKQQAVADALAADNAVDQAAVDAADAVVEAALNPPPA